MTRICPKFTADRVCLNIPCEDCGLDQKGIKPWTAEHLEYVIMHHHLLGEEPGYLTLREPIWKWNNYWGWRLVDWRSELLRKRVISAEGIFWWRFATVNAVGTTWEGPAPKHESGRNISKQQQRPLASMPHQPLQALQSLQVLKVRTTSVNAQLPISHGLVIQRKRQYGGIEENVPQKRRQIRVADENVPQRMHQYKSSNENVPQKKSQHPVHDKNVQSNSKRLRVEKHIQGAGINSGLHF